MSVRRPPMPLHPASARCQSGASQSDAFVVSRVYSSRRRSVAGRFPARCACARRALVDVWSSASKCVSKEEKPRAWSPANQQTISVRPHIVCCPAACPIDRPRDAPAMTTERNNVNKLSAVSAEANRRPRGPGSRLACSHQPTGNHIYFITFVYSRAAFTPRRHRRRT